MGENKVFYSKNRMWFLGGLRILGIDSRIDSVLVPY